MECHRTIQVAVTSSAKEPYRSYRPPPTADGRGERVDTDTYPLYLSMRMNDTRDKAKRNKDSHPNNNNSLQLSLQPTRALRSNVSIAKITD